MSINEHTALDDMIYAAAMLLFACLPCLSMRSRSRRLRAMHGQAVEPARVVAVVAFLLLLWLQIRKQYTLGIVMIILNTALRLVEVLLDVGQMRWWQRPRPTELLAGRTV